jgi:tetratricopeptide (TPR) repeat protein
MDEFNGRAMRQLASLLLFFLAVTPLFAQVADGDRHYALRAEGAEGGRAKAEHVDAAIAAYQRAVAQNAGDLDARWKLMRALRFKGAYVAVTNDQKKPIYDAAKTEGERTRTAVERLLAAHGVKSPSSASEKHVANAARVIPGAAEFYLWDAVNWGEWALAYGKLAAVRQGAADRIRREATIALLVDPKLEAAAPARVLGRLHDQTPHIPFITGWASLKEAVRFLNESLRLAPANKLTMLFLAEAMVDNDSSKKPEAIRILRATVAAPNDPAYLVEDAAATNDARAVLRSWGA